MIVERHLFENKNHTVRTEFRVYNGRVYNIKTTSQLTKTEKEEYKTNGKTIYHF